jgi:hypothetical protein
MTDLKRVVTINTNGRLCHDKCRMRERSECVLDGETLRLDNATEDYIRSDACIRDAYDPSTIARKAGPIQRLPARKVDCDDFDDDENGDSDGE